MIIAKFVLFVLPLIVASMLFLVNPATASVADSTSITTDINSANSQPVHKFVTLNQVDNSNPILDQLGCNCAYCAGVNSPLQGKLPIPNL
ncbi:MAG: hypothetical protein AAF630_00385 [Cyanobacteria bacterium P01_C01_bin.38]